MKEEDASRLKSLCLRHAGVRFSGFGGKPSFVSPDEAWTHVVRGDSPSIRFSDDCMAQAQSEWWRLAISNQLFSRHMECLISMGGIGGLPWARIQLPTHAPVLDIFAWHKGNPEFLALSESGEHLLAVTSEEDETWLYLVDCRGNQLKTLMPA